MQSAPNFSTTSLNMQATTTTAPSAGQNVGLCCHCGRGLPYDTYHICCLFCDLNICADCHRTHPATHQPYFKYLLDRKTQRGTRPTPAYCTKCKHPSHSGLSCNDCEFNICVNCVATSRDLLANHAHGKLTMTRAPDDLGLGMYSLQCDSCHAGATLSHCGRCLGGIKKGQNFWTCVTCIVDYNAQIRFCGDCQAPGLREHDPTHRFASFLYRVDITKDPKYNTVKCLDCKSNVPFSGRELARHPHSRFQLVMGEAERDRRYFQSYRTCARKPVRDMATMSAEAHDILCGCCNHKIVFNAKVFMCPTCTMITCETCAESGGARSHPHIMIPVFLERTIPFALLGQAMAKPNAPVKHCAKCDTSISPDSDSFIQCNHCEEWIICLLCTKRTNMPVRHACAEAVEMTFFDPLKQANNLVVAKIMMAQKAKAAAVALKQQQAALQPSFAIRRKNPSITSGSSISSISPVLSMAQTADLPQLPATSQPGSQLAMNQQLAQLSGLGSTGLPMQSALPSIQPSVQGPIYGEEVKRKSLQPGLKNASKAMFDGSANASKAAYNKASNMVENMDKDSMKKVGKKVAAVAGALGGQALRQYVRQETGLTLPRIRPNQKPNQQAQVANAQLLEINKLNALKQQLEMKQKILQLQNQVALQQQQQQLQQAQNQVALQQQQQQLQQAQNQAAIQASASAVPMAAANMLGQAQPGVPQMAPGAQSNQGMAGPGVLHQPTPIMGGTNGIPPAIAGVSTPGPYNSNLNSMAPTPLNEPSNTLGVPGYNPSAITSSQANVASSVHSFDSNEMAPIPASEMQWATTHALNPNHMAPIPPSEANAASVHSFDSEMAPIPACELNSLPVNDSSMAPIPPSEAGMAPIPACEQPSAGHSNSHDASHPASDHVNPSHHAEGEHTQQANTPATHSEQHPHSPDHHSNYHQPSVEDEPESETAQSTHATSSESHPTTVHDSSHASENHHSPGHQHDSQDTHGHPHDPHAHSYAHPDPNAQQAHDSHGFNSHADHQGHQSPQQSQIPANNHPFSSPATPTPSQGGYQQFTPHSVGSPNAHGASPNLHPFSGTHQPYPPTSSSPAPGQSHYAHSPSPQPQVYGPNVQQPPPNQNSPMPIRPPISGGGQADEYYQNHPLNQGGTAGGPSPLNNVTYPQQQNVPHTQINSQSLPPSLPPQTPITTMTGKPPQPQSSITALPGNNLYPSPQPLNPITGILPGATPATTASPGQVAPQININVQASGTGGTAQGTAESSNVAQMQQQANMNMQSQQIQALQQRIQMMNLQQQQASQQLTQQLQSIGNQQNSGNSQLIEQLQLQLLTSQLQGGQQQQGNNHPLLQEGLSIINNLTSNTGQHNHMNNILQQQQQLEMQFLNQMNQMQQHELNAEMTALNNQEQANFQLEQLNAQLAGLNSMSGNNDTTLMSNNLDVVDVNNYNVNIDVDQSINMQSNVDLGFGMSGTDTVGFDMSGMGTVGFDMTSTDTVGFDMSGTDVGFDMSSSTDVAFGMDDGSAFVSESTFDSVDFDF
ncbi:hypothetical protein TMatcc_001090 [Talaromyces marneffei ATCC 18224]